MGVSNSQFSTSVVANRGRCGELEWKRVGVSNSQVSTSVVANRGQG